MKVIEGIKSKCCNGDVYKIYNERCPGQEEEFVCFKCDKECDFYEPITNMNNKQWEEELEQLKPRIKDLTGNFEQAKDIIQMFFDEYWIKQKPAIKQFIRQREAEIRKETILAVLPEEECCGGDYWDGFNKCLQTVKYNFKSLYNINLE